MISIFQPTSTNLINVLIAYAITWKSVRAALNTKRSASIYYNLFFYLDARNKDDEFFFVPSGYRPKETTEKEEKAGVGQNADFEAHPSVFKGYVPVRAHKKKTANPVTLKIKKKKRRKERILNFYK